MDRVTVSRTSEARIGRGIGSAKQTTSGIVVTSECWGGGRATEACQHKSSQLWSRGNMREGWMDAMNRDSKDLPPVVLLLAPKPPLFPNVLDEPPNWKLLLPPPPKAMMALVVEGQRNIEAEMSERDGRYSVERCRTRKNKRLSSGRSIAARW